MVNVTDELRVLAETLAQWVDAAPGVSAIYLFGSRVRGDHRPDSDVDVRLFVENVRWDDQTKQWWQHHNETLLADIDARLPGPIALHRDTPDNADQHIRSGKHVLVVGKVVCVLTPRLKQ